MRIFSKKVRPLFLAFVGSIGLLASSVAFGQIAAQNNVALKKPASQSSSWSPTQGMASNANDGAVTGSWPGLNHTQNGPNEFWMVDLQGSFQISKISINNRTDCCNDRIVGATVQILNSKKDVVFKAPITSSGPLSEFTVPAGTVGSFVRVLNKPNDYLHMGEVQVLGTPAQEAVTPIVSVAANVALNKPSKQTSTYCEGTVCGTAGKANDGKIAQNWPDLNHTMDGPSEFWQVDLQGAFTISAIKIHNRGPEWDNCCTARIVGAKVEILDAAEKVVHTETVTKPILETDFVLPAGIVGNHVRIRNQPKQSLHMSEVEVIGIPAR